MRKIKLFLILIFFSNVLLAQKRKLEEPPPPISLESEKSVNRETIKENRKPYFDFQKDFENYIIGKECKYKDVYEKYSKTDSVPIIRKIVEKRDLLPPPCYEIKGDSVKTGMKYKSNFLLMFGQKDLYCKKDGSGYDKGFYKLNHVTFSLYKSTGEAFELLQQHDKTPFTEEELKRFFEEAKDYFRNGNYAKSNALFSFLANVDEHYREASLNNVGLSFYNQKEYGYGLEFFRKAVELYPKGYLGYLNAGACLANLPVDLGDENQSGTYFKKAYELAPNNPNAIFNYANALKQYTSQGVDIQTLKENLFAKAVESKQDEPVFKTQFAKTQHQKALDEAYDEKLFENALDAYNEAIRLFPNYADNYMYKAKLFGSWKRNKQYPENRILADSICLSLKKYKTLVKGYYDTQLDRLCVHYPKFKNEFVKNYTELLAGWEELSIAKGDLNKDGFDDVAIIVREIDKGKVKNIVRYDTPNQERGMKNYNESSLYILLFNPLQNNYIIKEAEDKLFAIDDGYYDNIFEVQIINGTLRLIRQENPNGTKFTQIFRLEEGKMMCIGENRILLKDKLGYVSESYRNLNSPIEKFNISYNFNTKIMEIAKPNQSTGKKETQSYNIEIDKFELKNASDNEYEVYKKAEKIIKAN